jgi:transcriptional regulator with XRE-family HTH domain
MTSDGTSYTLDAIRDVLTERGMSQRELARRLGWGRMRLQHLLKGNTRLGLADLQSIAAELDAPVTRFLFTSEPAS